MCPPTNARWWWPGKPGISTFEPETSKLTVGSKHIGRYIIYDALEFQGILSAMASKKGRTMAWQGMEMDYLGGSISKYPKSLRINLPLLGTYLGSYGFTL